MKFRSAVDPWFYILALGFPAVVFIAAVATIGELNTASIVVVTFLALLVFGLPVWLLFTTYYVVNSDTLKIRSGPFSWSVQISDIKSIEASRSLLSSPALSLDRLEVHYGRGLSVLVSPRDREGFLRAIGIGT